MLSIIDFKGMKMMVEAPIKRSANHAAKDGWVYEMMVYPMNGAAAIRKPVVKLWTLI